MLLIPELLKCHLKWGSQTRQAAPTGDGRSYVVKGIAGSRGLIKDPRDLLLSFLNFLKSEEPKRCDGKLDGGGGCL